MPAPTRTKAAPRTNKRSVSLRATAITAGLAFVLGAWSTHELTRPAAQAVAHWTDKVSVLAAWRDANLLARFKAIDWSNRQPEGVDDIARGLGVSAALRTHLLQRFRQETNDTARSHLLNLLLVAPTPELAAKAQQWAGDAHSAKTRLDGFALLWQMQPTEESRALFLNALQHEQDAEVLAGAVLVGLGRSDVPAPPMVSQVLARLHELTRHAQAEVRHAALVNLQRFDLGVVDYNAYQFCLADFEKAAAASNMAAAH